MKNQILKKRFLKAGIMIVLLVAADQITKIVADIVLAEKTISVIGDFFQLDLAYNPGFGFSMGTGWPQWLSMAIKILIPLSAALFTFFRLKASDCTRLEALSLILLTAGAFGNLIDRLFRGYVIDFLLFKMYGLFGFQYWPTFNVADILVVSGTIGFAITQLLAAVREHEAEKRKSEAGHAGEGEPPEAQAGEGGVSETEETSAPEVPETAPDIAEEGER